jgi:hypothetical protein
VDWLKIVQVGGVFALGKCATGTGDVVAHRAVDTEQLCSVGGIAITGVVAGVWQGRAWCQSGNPRSHGVNLGLSELNRLDLSLWSRSGHRHPAGAHLEVNRERAHTNNRGPSDGALTEKTVTTRTVREEQLLAFFDERGL